MLNCITIELFEPLKFAYEILSLLSCVSALYGTHSSPRVQYDNFTSVLGIPNPELALHCIQGINHAISGYAVSQHHKVYAGPD